MFNKSNLLFIKMNTTTDFTTTNLEPIINNLNFDIEEGVKQKIRNEYLRRIFTHIRSDSIQDPQSSSVLDKITKVFAQLGLQIGDDLLSCNQPDSNLLSFAEKFTKLFLTLDQFYHCFHDGRVLRGLRNSFFDIHN